MRWKLSWEKENSDLEKCLSRVGTAITGTYTGSTSEQPRLLVSGKTSTICTQANAKCPSTPLIQARLPSWEGGWCQIGEGTHLKGMEPAQTQPSKLLLQPLGNRPYPLQSQWRPRNRGQAPETPGCERTTPSPAQPPTRRQLPANQRKGRFGVTSVSALPRKPLGTSRLQGDTPAQRHPLETATEAMQAHLQKQEKSQINNLTDHLEHLENKKQIKPKVSRDFEEELYLVLLDQYIFEEIFWTV